MRALALPAFLLLTTCCVAQDHDEKLPPINPDRPDFTDGSGITPRGRWLLEVGYRQTRANGSTSIEYGDEPTLRFGFQSNLEFRFIAPAYATGSDIGWEDGSVGLKWRIREGEHNSPSLALEAGTTLPTGARALRSPRLQPTVIGIIDFDLERCGEVSANFGATFLEQFTQCSASISYDRELGPRLSGFLEGYSLMPGGPALPDDHFADAGVQFLLTNDCMVDGFIGAQLDRHRQGSFFGAGVSFRF